MSTQTKAERSARNKRAHAIRRALTQADFRAAQADGATISWRQISDTYTAIPVDVILSDYANAPDDPAGPRAVEMPAKTKRRAPAHIAALQIEYALARETWERGLEDAIAGGRSRAAGGRPANGEAYPDEERDYRAAYPAPMWRDFLSQRSAEMREAKAAS